MCIVHAYTSWLQVHLLIAAYMCIHIMVFKIVGLPILLNISLYLLYCTPENFLPNKIYNTDEMVGGELYST